VLTQEYSDFHAALDCDRELAMGHIRKIEDNEVVDSLTVRLDKVGGIHVYCYRSLTFLSTGLTAHAHVMSDHENYCNVPDTATSRRDQVQSLASGSTRGEQIYGGEL
jgi:hypothetical protein